MGDGHNFEQLRREILALSRAKDWEVARKEWRLVGISEAEQPETCLCGHYPIIEICQILNRITGHQADVGNRCVKRFLGFRSDLIFAAIRRIRKDLNNGLNADAISFVFEQGMVTDWEYSFLQSTKNKRILSSKQVEVRQKINAKVLAHFDRRVP